MCTRSLFGFSNLGRRFTSFESESVRSSGNWRWAFKKYMKILIQLFFTGSSVFPCYLKTSVTNLNWTNAYKCRNWITVRIISINICDQTRIVNIKRYCMFKVITCQTAVSALHHLHLCITCNSRHWCHRAAVPVKATRMVISCQRTSLFWISSIIDWLRTPCMAAFSFIISSTSKV